MIHLPILRSFKLEIYSCVLLVILQEQAPFMCPAGEAAPVQARRLRTMDERMEC